MSTPPQVQERRPAGIAQPVRSIRLGTLITAWQGDFEASPVPMVLKRSDDALTLKKMAQNKNDADRRGVMAGLSASPDQAARAVGAVMCALENQRRAGARP